MILAERNRVEEGVVALRAFYMNCNAIHDYLMLLLSCHYVCVSL